jgi:cold shock CspA family protein
MRYQGKITNWTDERGFGFIAPNGGGERVFVHISAFNKGQPRPSDGVLVTYELAKDEKKGYHAQNVMFVGRRSVESDRSEGTLRTILTLLLVAVVGIAGWQHFSQKVTVFESGRFSENYPETSQINGGDQALANAFANHQSNLQIQGRGTVIRVLPDDVNGSRHQRFILRVGSGQTLLVAHNIDLAPRIGSLREGDEIMFNGEYEWNQKGGVIHWTHHDPNGSHIAGWIKHNGQTYQ